VNVTATLEQSLTAEGSSGTVIAYAAYADGSLEDVSASPGLGLAVDPAYAASLAVTRPGLLYQVAVPANANSLSSASALLVTLNASCPSSVLASGGGSVTVTLPTAVSAAVACSVATLASPTSAASEAGHWRAHGLHPLCQRDLSGLSGEGHV
jgi:hypothetical protein